MTGVPRLVLAAACALLIAGCALGPRFVQTQVTNYNEWSTLPADKSYTFARTLEYQSSLELKSYEDIVRDELAQKGFRYVPDTAQANLIVTLRPSVTDTRVRLRDPWPIDPFWSGYGFYGRRGFGWYDPYWSAFGDFNSYTVDIAHRRLEMDIDSKAVTGKRYYEGRVETSSEAESFKAIVPYMVRALFSDFPGNNGQTRRVDVPVERK
jgi:hypothetical protein